MPLEPVIKAANVNYFFGKGALRKQILFDVCIEVFPGEIVIMTGPSGSGKTTILTLMGCLRSLQEGSLNILSRELLGLSGTGMRDVRRGIGYIFQAHNLVMALSACENVEMGLNLVPGLNAGEKTKRAIEMLGRVGMDKRINHRPGELSGGQRQRVAIARALAPNPRILLADEPTAALDKKSGREVVDLMHGLAKQQGCAILLVTHDNRILDIADRIVYMEDGRISSFTSSVVNQNRNFLNAIIKTSGAEELPQKVHALTTDQFLALLEETTREYQEVLTAAELIQSHASDAILDQLILAFTLKVEKVMEVERATLFLLDDTRDEIWSKVARDEDGKPLEIRMPSDRGIAGEVIRTSRKLTVTDPYSHPLFNKDVDVKTGFKTRNIVCLPLKDRNEKVFGAVQLINRAEDKPFSSLDEERFGRVASGIGVILESWVKISSLKARA